MCKTSTDLYLFSLPELGAELDAVLGEAGSLDPLNQHDQFEGDQFGGGPVLPEILYTDDVTNQLSASEPVILDSASLVAPVPAVDVVGSLEDGIWEAPAVESFSGIAPASDVDPVVQEAPIAIDISSLDAEAITTLNDINVDFLPEFDLPKLEDWAENGPEYIKAVLDSVPGGGLNTDPSDDVVVFEVRPSE